MDKGLSPSRKPLRRAVAHINVTPLVDVLLILVVLLMLAMPMYVKRLPVDLPRTELGGVPTPQQVLPVALYPGGKVRLAQADVELPVILDKINSGVTVELAIDKTVQYDDIAQVITAIQARQPKEIVLITR
jgi:biopolymer transport protein ExbD